MAQPIISVEHLSKKYCISHRGKGRSQYSTLREAIAGGAKHLVSNLTPGKRPPADTAPSQEDFWALKDVSFEVQQGEVLGIIGRNGAGKSTLLKILSRITEPTEGRVTLRGRVASLLEVGTGFHPELTGRENVYLNGAILGMSRAEIKRKFDEIVDFAGVEKFLDTPVKRYSSGMYVRLAFAVAAHLEPEILIVDEVLAVGDAEFQKKCMGKMQDVSTKEGRTVLFVSHNLAAIRQLCSTGLLLADGRVINSGNTADVTQSYLTVVRTARTPMKPTRPRIIEVQLRDKSDVTIAGIEAGEKAFLLIRLDTQGSRRLHFGMTIFDSDDIGIFSALSSDTIEFIPPLSSEMKIWLPTELLNAGRYRVEGCLVDDETMSTDTDDSFLQFDIYRSGPFEMKKLKAKGMLRFPGEWEFYSTAVAKDPIVQAS